MSAGLPSELALKLALKAEEAADEAQPEVITRPAAPLPIQVRGAPVTLLTNLTQAVPYAGPESLDVLDLGDTYNGIALWFQAVGVNDTITVRVEGSFAAAGPWAVLRNPDNLADTYTFTSSGYIQLVTGCRFIRVNPSAVTGNWTVVAVPFLAGGVPTLPRQPTYTEGRVYVANVAVDTTGVKLSYTVPAGRRARITQAVWSASGGTTRLEVVIAGAVIPVTSGTSLNQLLDLNLTAGDTVQFNVTTAGAAGTTGSGLITYLEVA